MEKIIFATNNKRKLEDLKSVLNELNYDIEVLGLEDIGWSFGLIKEEYQTLEENSCYKAAVILGFCKSQDKEFNYPIISDSSALVFSNLDSESGIYTERYADDELDIRPIAPDYQCLFKLLRNLKKYASRDAVYKCVITYMMPDGQYFQETGETKGYIADSFIGSPERPYYYSIFIADGYRKLFNELNNEELKDTFRHKALRKVLTKKDENRF